MHKVISWRIVALIAAVVVIGRCHGPTPAVGPDGALEGTWGGSNAGVIAGDTIQVQIGCASGSIPEKILPDAEGRFDMFGEQRVGAHRVPHPARFTGRVVGNEMSLTVTLTDTAVVLGPVLVVYEKEPRMKLCKV